MVAVANPGNGKSIADASPCARVDVDFSKALQECLDQVGPGRVATCGAIARALGDIRAARSVATWLNTHPDTRGATASSARMAVRFSDPHHRNSSEGVRHY